MLIASAACSEITSNIWANMKQNCGLSQTINAANNFSIFNTYVAESVH